MEIVYVSSKYCGTTKKFFIKANIYCREAWEQGFLPIAPNNIVFQFLDQEEAEERHEGFKLGLMLMKLCDQVWIVGEDYTKAMIEEIKYAKSLGKENQVLHNGYGGDKWKGFFLS